MLRSALLYSTRLLLTMSIYHRTCYTFQPDTDALICSAVSGQVSIDHYVADQGYGTPTKTTPVSIDAQTSSGC